MDRITNESVQTILKVIFLVLKNYVNLIYWLLDKDYNAINFIIRFFILKI